MTTNTSETKKLLIAAFKESETLTVTAIQSHLFHLNRRDEVDMCYVGDLLILQELLRRPHFLDICVLEFSNGSIFEGCRIDDENLYVVPLVDSEISSWVVSLEDSDEYGNIEDFDEDEPVRAMSTYMEVIELIDNRWEQWVIQIDEYSAFAKSELSENHKINILSYKESTDE